jgi:Tol biopolymer transport system component
VNPDGSGKERLSCNAASSESPSWSPDGARIVYEHNGGATIEECLYTIDVASRSSAPLNGICLAQEPTWSPDGREIAFAYLVIYETTGSICCTALATSSAGPGSWAPMSSSSESPLRGLHPAWSPDGSKLLYAGIGGIWMLDRSTGATKRIVPMESGRIDWAP